MNAALFMVVTSADRSLRDEYQYCLPWGHGGIVNTSYIFCIGFFHIVQYNIENYHSSNALVRLYRYPVSSEVRGRNTSNHPQF